MKDDERSGQGDVKRVQVQRLALRVSRIAKKDESCEAYVEAS